MLQMRPWKMSLLLEGNNNSKFQLLLTLQSSVFPSDRMCRQGESEFASIDFSLLAPPNSSSLCSPPSLPGPPTPPAGLVPTGAHPPHPPSISKLTPIALSAHLLEGKGWETKNGHQGGPQLFPGQDTALWINCLSHCFPPASHSLRLPSWLSPHLFSSPLNIDNRIRRQLMSAKFL